MNIPSWAELIGVASAAAGLSPILSALIIQWNMPPWAKVLVGLIVAFGTALLAAMLLLPDWPQGVAEWITFGVAVIVGSQAAYAKWRKIGIEVLEAKTTIVGGGPAGTHAAGK